MYFVHNKYVVYDHEECIEFYADSSYMGASVKCLNNITKPTSSSKEYMSSLVPLCSVDDPKDFITLYPEECL